MEKITLVVGDYKMIEHEMAMNKKIQVILKSIN